jgi:transcriptional regulator with XRE-family HTH domain
MTIGRQVRKARKALELKQQDLADEIEVTSQHISRIELDQAAPSVETLLKLSRRLGVTTDYLLTGRQTTPLDATGAIRAEPGISATAKRHLIGVLNELRAAK